VARVLDFVEGLLATDDVGLFVGDLGVATEEGDQAHQSSPFGLLSVRGWILAYGQSQVGPTSSSGQLVDHMVTSKPVPATVKVFATTNQKDRNQPAVTKVPLSDHNVVKATFSLRYPISEADKADLMPQQYYIGEDEGVQLLAEASLHEKRRRNFPLAFRPDPSDTSYVGTCARYEFECQDLMNERTSEQQAMEEITATLSEQMWRLRDQCSEQIHSKSVLIQRIQEAKDSVTSMNETWSTARATLEAELEDEKFQKEHVEVELRAEEEELKMQIAQGTRQLENMAMARRSLGRHLSNMGKIKAVMQGDIEDEKRMTNEIAEAGEKQMLEWAAKQNEIRVELNDALAAHRADHHAWEAQKQAELQLDWDRKSELDAEEVDLQHRLRRAHEEMAHQAQELRTEAAENARELQKLNESIAEELQASNRLEETRPDCEENTRMSVLRAAELRKVTEECKVEITTLTQDCDAIKAHLEELRVQVAKAKPKSSRDVSAKEVIKNLETTKIELDASIEIERKRQEDLQSRLRMAEQRPGLFSCFRPKARAPPIADAASKSSRSGTAKAEKQDDDSSVWC
jgi:hypothetical protein